MAPQLEEVAGPALLVALLPPALRTSGYFGTTSDVSQGDIDVPQSLNVELRMCPELPAEPTPHCLVVPLSEI